MRSWIAGVAVAIALVTPPTLRAAREGYASVPALVPASESAAAAPVAQPAVYTGAAAPVLSPAVGTPVAGAPGPGGLAVPAVGPAPDFAWLLALGFLGLIVLRRTRAVRAF
jgi:hypothetical protein